MRVYLIGSTSCGKTTLARYISDKYNLPLLAEVARAVLAEKEINFGLLKSNINLINEFQTEIFKRQIEIENKCVGGFISDRSFDSLAYAAINSIIVSKLFNSKELKEYIEHVKGGIIFFVRPNRNLLSEDGIRSFVEWDHVMQVDGAVKFMLEIFEIPYIDISNINMSDRVRTIDCVLGNVILKENK